MLDEITTLYVHFLSVELKPGFHMIVTVGDASPRQARGHIGDSCVKWKHFLSDVSDVADQTATVRGRIKKVEMSLKRGFHVIIKVIVSICRRLIGDTSPKRSRLLRSYGNQALMPPVTQMYQYLLALWLFADCSVSSVHSK